MRLAQRVVIVALLLLAGALGARGAEWYQTTDFFCLYQGSRALVVGADPYDEAWWASVTGGRYPPPLFAPGPPQPSSCPGRYGYPLWTAVALLPFGVLPLEAAASLWAALSVGGVVVAMAASWRAVRGPHRLAWPYAIVVLASQPFWILLISGQLDGVTAALIALVALALATGRRRAAGLALALTAVKPQIVVLAAPAVLVHALVRREARLLTSAVAAGVAMLVVPMLLVPAWPLEWLDEIVGRRSRVTGLLPTAWGLSADLFGSTAAAAVLIAALGVALWLVVRRRTLATLDVLVLSVPVSLFVTPYAWSYDHLALTLPWAYLLARVPGRGRARPAALIAIVVLATLLPWTLYAVAFTRGGETLSAIVPALTAMAVAVAMRGADA